MKNYSHKTSAELAEIFFQLASHLNIGLKNDDTGWTDLADEMIGKRSRKDQQLFWEEMLSTFISLEQASKQHHHKGGIYWKLALLSASKKTIDDHLGFLKKSRADDLRRGDQFSASIGLLSIIDPLYTYIKSDPNRAKLFESLSPQEDRNFFDTIFNFHDLTVFGRIKYITPPSWSFVADPCRKEVLSRTYYEIFNILKSLEMDSYYSCVFSIGSVLEGFIDDLFERDGGKLWGVFLNDSRISKKVKKFYHNKTSNPRGAGFLTKAKYPKETTLGTKIQALQFMLDYKICPFPRIVILELNLINCYRNLIHPNKQENFGYIANRYLASVLFAFLADAAHYLWPSRKLADTCKGLIPDSLCSRIEQITDYKTARGETIEILEKFKINEPEKFLTSKGL